MYIRRRKGAITRVRNYVYSIGEKDRRNKCVT